MRLPISASVTFAAMMAVAGTAFAQAPPIPADRATQLQDIGRIVSPPKTSPLYAPLQEKEPYQGVRIERNAKYGLADRNGLDVFMPEQSSAPRPVLMFVHGGAFIGGDKRSPESPFYDNIMLWAVKNGFVGINVNYRLAPQAPWPLAEEDVASAVLWVSEKIGERGGDPARIYLMGHSAGATHIAGYVSHPEFYKVKGGGLAGAIFVSGLYDLAATPVSDPEQAYFGSDPAHYGEQSSLRGLLSTSIPFMLAAAELDPPGFEKQFKLLKEESCKRTIGCARAEFLPQHSHMSEVYAINTADDRLTAHILDFVRSEK
jgi:acetyl esterase/lipase